MPPQEVATADANMETAAGEPVTTTDYGTDSSLRKQQLADHDQIQSAPPSNEYVLNVAFFSFVAFFLVQTVFALVAHSQSMLADSQAMAVDAMTYLFNLCAERVKQRDPENELKRLYLELIPPSISVVTLILVTVVTLREAIGSLREAYADTETASTRDIDDDVSVPIMLIFSGANLLLDIVNVTCFAKANSAFGLHAVQEETHAIRESLRSSFAGHHHHLQSESTHLLQDDIEGQRQSCHSHQHRNCKTPSLTINLNMCSAWTHVCADTMRSTAVLIAAAVAFVFVEVDAGVADSVAAIVVSAIILISLVPLIHGLAVTTARIFEILWISRQCCQ